MVDNIRVIAYGLGPIGSAAARLIANRECLILVGGVDIDTKKVGKDIGQVIGLNRNLGIKVTEKLEETLARTKAEVVLHTTSSYFDLFAGQILEILDAGLNIVSTSEELSFPWGSHSHVGAEIDRIAKLVGKTVIGTGVNPGFIMDTLPLSLTAICQEVNSLYITRVINALERRGPFQAKIGLGLSPQEFQARIESGRMGHVGLRESVEMVFDTLQHQLAHYESYVEPVLAEQPISTPYFQVEPGQVRGLKQVARAEDEKGEFMKLTFLAALGEEQDGDLIEIKGIPNVEMRLRGSNGDIATVAIAVNAIRRVYEASPGLKTMRDLPIVTCW